MCINSTHQTELLSIICRIVSVMRNLARTLIVSSVSCLILGCGSGGDDVNNLFDIDGPSSPVDKDLSIAITSPTTNGTPTGHSKNLAGTCGTAGVTIRVDLDSTQGVAFTACGVDETWEVDVDTSSAAVGSMTLSARMVDDDLTGSAASITVNKLGTECDSESARADTFANTSTTGIPPWIICTSLQLSNIGTTYQNDDITLGNDISFGGGNYASQGGTGGGTDNGFTGTFDGRGFEISDFTINATTATQQGLFREAMGATFQDILLDNITVNGSYYLGALVGFLEDGGTTTFSNITASNITFEAFHTGNNGHTGVLFGGARDGATNLVVSDVSVSNISVNSFKNNQSAVMGYIGSITSADIDRVSISGGDINARANGGSLIGSMSNNNTAANITIDDVINSANVTCTDVNCGGIMGYGEGIINNIANTGDVTSSGTSDVGGLIGEFRDGTIAGSSAAATRDAVTPPAIPSSNPPTIDDSTGFPVSCYNTGNVTATAASRVAGIIAYSYRDTDTMTSCYNTGNISGGNEYVAGLIGNAERIDISDSFSTGDVSGAENYIAGLVGYHQNYTPSSTITNMYSSGNVTASGVSPVYIGGAFGRWNPTTAVSNIWYSGDISAVGGDDSGRMESIGGVFGYAYVNGMSFTNIHSAGSITVTASGTGQDHRYIGGVFGSLRGSLDQSTSTMSVDAQQARQVGGLIGQHYRDSVTNAYATGDVMGTDQVGGLIGYTDRYENIIEDSYATGNVTSVQVGGSAYAGGLVGVSGANIRRCYASGDVTADGDYVGGIEGGRASNWDRELRDSFATGDVDGGSGDYVGGISGQFRGFLDTFINNFATGSVRGNSDVGGLIGYFYRRQDNAVRYSYAYGTVVRATGGSGADSRFGPIIGRFNGSVNGVDSTSVYYNSDFMPMDEGTGLAIASPNLSNVNALTSAQMIIQANFVNFDFGTPDWEMPSGSLVLPGQGAAYTYPVQEWVE